MITPAVLKNVTRDMPVFQEETFGPVLPILTCDSEQEMIDIANDSEFGLGASIFTGDEERVAREIAPKIEAGSIFINDFVKSLVPVPFGGAKGSGIGRELGPAGIKEFTNQKVVSIKTS
jgi:succinate-semialdehyde dehydrogenase/glutarate-semialdehyde dehydrogenase